MEEEKNEVEEKKKMSLMLKLLIAFIIVVLIAVLMCASVWVWYTNSIKAMDENSEESKVVEIEPGKVAVEIANILKQNEVIKNELSFQIYCKLNKINNLQAGTYEFSTNMNIEQIVKKLQDGDVLRKDISILFPEGKNMRTVAKIISDKTTNTYEEVMNIFESKSYAEKLIDKYWFLTSEILDDDIYYPLEGYLFPNTYIFESYDVSIDTIIEKMLDQTDKVLSNYKGQIASSGYSVHKFLSLASLAECEGTNSENRQGIAGVFFNRLNIGMALQSDVTTYYAFKVDMGERDLTMSELNTYNKYNTRGPNMLGKLPIGPISNVSESSIKATLNPTNTDALFFVADKNGKIYFTKTNEEHDQIIRQLQQQGLWYVYD